MVSVMAEQRMAQCPDCDTERETRAQPRTKLKCRGCGSLYLAPGLSPTPQAGPEPIPAADPEPIPAVDPEPAGIKVVRADKVAVRPVEPIQSAVEGSEPTPAADPEPTVIDDPAPDPVPAISPGRVRRSGRSRRPIGRGRT